MDTNNYLTISSFLIVQAFVSLYWNIVFVDGVHNRKMIHSYWNGLRKGVGSEETINPSSLPDEMKSVCSFIMIFNFGFNIYVYMIVNLL